jgi:hypothetical protein
LWHLVQMRHLRSVLLIAVALASGGCFQMTTVLKVNGDATGTIDHQMIFTKAALAQLRQLGALSGGRAQGVDLTSEQQAREMASGLGPGVTYVSSTPVTTAEGEGRATIYAFTDVSQIRVNQQPEAPGGINVQGPNADSGTITCSLTHEANGNAVLHVNLPEPNIPGATGEPAAGNPAVAAQLAVMRSLLRGARVTIAVEPHGRLVRTNSPHVDGQRVTLLDVDLDRLLGDDAFVAKLQAAKTQDELKELLKAAPGLKIVLEREVTIEFTPEK